MGMSRDYVLDLDPEALGSTLSWQREAVVQGMPGTQDIVALTVPVDLSGRRRAQRMLVDSMKQVTGTAGDYQVEGANRVATLNIGGSTATTASFIVEGAAE